MIFADKKFSNPIKIIEAFDNESFKLAFDEIEKYRKSHYLLGYIRYEAKEIFLGRQIKSGFPLLYFEVFEGYEDFVPEDLPFTEFLNPIAQISYDEYKKSLHEIKSLIAQGETYQVNYTYDYAVSSGLEGLELYQQILKNQKTPYNAYIKNHHEEILSFSPELFFEIEGNIIKTKPMKGTVKRGRSAEEDLQNIEFLQNDIKNRAENVMIVDLLRNDLGKIAKTGTVKVDKLFEVETHNTLHQMTSEVSAELLPDVDFYRIFEAIFPCGSVTGAPKISTMKIIDKLEVGKREVYCGAIGLISPVKTVFSVPIRILQKKNTEADYRCRVGGAIVWDSEISEEWDETLTKIKFLAQNIDFKLVETLKIENLELVLGDLHFKRLQNSANELGFKFNDEILKIRPQFDGMMRLLLSKDGNFEVQYLLLSESQTGKVVISKTPVNSKEKFLQYKTTYRPWYETSGQKIKSGEIYDEIFFNEKGELTEGARTNIVLEIDDCLYTPPLECGLLGGVLRQNMLKENKIKEKILYLSDLKSAQNVYCINSVRGIRRVEVDFD
ncbi:MAG: aminodeoxychorismate synthase component I [bacterium]